jgi:hypothetical protein
LWLRASGGSLFSGGDKDQFITPSTHLLQLLRAAAQAWRRRQQQIVRWIVSCFWQRNTELFFDQNSLTTENDKVRSLVNNMVFFAPIK